MSRINLSTTILTGPTTSDGPLGAQAVIAGLFERGDVNRPTAATSYDQLVAKIGPEVPYGSVHEEARIAFAAGATRVLACRAVGPAATVATVTVNDRAAVPVATMRFDAVNPGAWGAAHDVRVAAGTLAGTVRISVLLRATGAVLVGEDYDNLPDRPAIVDALRDSQILRATALATATAPPADLPAVGTYALVGGSDDRAAVTAEIVIAALDDAPLEEFGPGVVLVPGFPASSAAGALTVGARVRAHCLANRRIAYLHEALEATDAQLVAAARALVDAADARDPGRVVTVVGPWIRTRNAAGRLRDVPPTGFVAGLRARAHQRVGPHRWPAGELAVDPRVVEVVDVSRRLSIDAADTLEQAGVTPLRALTGGVRPAGYACCAANRLNWPSVAESDLINMLHEDAERLIEDVQFTPVDGRGQFLAKVGGLLVGLAHTYLGRGALFEGTDPDTDEVLDPGYAVDVSKQLNPVANLARQRVRARLSVRPAPTAASFDIDIVKAGLSASLGG